MLLACLFHYDISIDSSSNSGSSNSGSTTAVTKGKLLNGRKTLSVFDNYEDEIIEEQKVILTSTDINDDNSNNDHGHHELDDNKKVGNNSIDNNNLIHNNNNDDDDDKHYRNLELNMADNINNNSNNENNNNSNNNNDNNNSNNSNIKNNNNNNNNIINIDDDDDDDSNEIRIMMKPEFISFPHCQVSMSTTEQFQIINLSPYTIHIFSIISENQQFYPHILFQSSSPTSSSSSSSSSSTSSSSSSSPSSSFLSPSSASPSSSSTSSSNKTPILVQLNAYEEVTVDVSYLPLRIEKMRTKLIITTSNGNYDYFMESLSIPNKYQLFPW